MLALFVLLILVGACAFIIGHGLLTLLDPGRDFDRSGDRAIICTWLGLLILVNLLIAVALVGPLSPPVGLVALALLLGLSLSRGHLRAGLGSLLRGTAPRTYLGIAALALGVAAYCSQVVVWVDSGLYHVQMAKWLSEFGIVPGMGLIHARFGFVSAWFALPAMFNAGGLEGRTTSFPGALCLLLMLIHVCIALARLAGQRARTGDIFVVAASALALPVILVSGMAVSSSPDLPVIALGIVTGGAMLALPERGGFAERGDFGMQPSLVPLMIGIGAASIKLSALPLAVAGGLFYLFYSGAAVRKVMVAAGLASLVLAPVAAAGAVSSGCAFYPVSFLCADVPWSLGSSAEAMSSVITTWARWGGRFAPDGATAWNWIFPWLGAEKTAAMLLLFSMLAMIRLVSVRSSMSFASSCVMASAIGGIAFMLYAAPTWRFGLPYLVLLPALAFASLGSGATRFGAWMQGAVRVKTFEAWGAIVAMGVAVHGHLVPPPFQRVITEEVAARFRGQGNPQFNLWRPPRTWSVILERGPTGQLQAFENTVVPDRIEELQYFRPQAPDRTTLCWDAPLPCATDRLENVRLRDSRRGLAGGFERIVRRGP